MKITKRNGALVDFNPNKILKRIKDQAQGLKVDSDAVTIEVQNSLYDGVGTLEIDSFAIRTAVGKSTLHPHYDVLAGRLYITQMRKDFEGKSYKKRMGALLDPSLMERVINMVQLWKDMGSKEIFESYNSLTTFFTVYANKNEQKEVLELPEELYARVACSLGNDSSEELEFFFNLIYKKISMASPILMNAGTTDTLISCALVTLEDDSLAGMQNTVTEMAMLSSHGAGLGVYLGNLRSSETPYRKGKGKACGIVPYAKQINEVMGCYKQSETRRGAAAIYTEVWHHDLLKFLDLRLPNGDEKLRARDLYLGLICNDLFFKYVEEDKDWYLVCPKEVKDVLDIDLTELWGDSFESIYISDIERLCKEGKLQHTKIKAKDVMSTIIYAMMRSGMPYIVHKDAVNRTYNQKNLGTFKTMNLCAEYIGYTDKDNTSMCALASIVLPTFVKEEVIDYAGIYDAAYMANKMLNRVLDRNKWSTEKSRNAGLEQRTVGLGIMGLADVFVTLGIAYDSKEAKHVSTKIQANVYHASITSSCDFALLNQEKYVTNAIVESELVENGKFHQDFVGHEEKYNLDWGSLRQRVTTSGVSNSLFCCNMPTASTSVLYGFTESFEPLNDIVSVRSTIAGEKVQVNPLFVDEMEKIGLWNTDVLRDILEKNSIQDIAYIPSTIKNIFKTRWDIKMRDYIDMCAERQIFIDQSQSMNLFYKTNDFAPVYSALMYGWKKGLKTGVYYSWFKPSSEGNKTLAFKANDADNKMNCIGCQ